MSSEDEYGDYEVVESESYSDLSLMTNLTEQDKYLRKEYGPDILISRSAMNPNIVRIYKPSGTVSPKPFQMAEGEFQVITFMDRYGLVIHEVTFLESSEWLNKKKKAPKSFWKKLFFWR